MSKGMVGGSLQKCLILLQQLESANISFCLAVRWVQEDCSFLVHLSQVTTIRNVGGDFAGRTFFFSSHNLAFGRGLLHKNSSISYSATVCSSTDRGQNLRCKKYHLECVLSLTEFSNREDQNFNQQNIQPPEKTKHLITIF